MVKMLPLQLKAVHKKNRGGIYPTPGALVNLGVPITDDDLDNQEASHGGVCVQ